MGDSISLHGSHVISQQTPVANMLANTGVAAPAASSADSAAATVAATSTVFATSTDGGTTPLPNGDYVVSSETSNGASNYQIHVQLYSPGGAPIGPAFAETAPPVSLFTDPVVASLADGSYEAAWVQQGNYSSQLLLEHFSAQGEALGQATIAHYGGLDVIGSSGYALAGLPDGDFVAAWTVQDTLNGAGAPQVWAGEFTAAGAPVGSPTQLGTAASANPAPVIETEANGHYVVSWTSPTGPESQAFADPAGSPPQALGPAQSSQLAAIAPAPVSGAASGAISGSAESSSALAPQHPLASTAAGLMDLSHLMHGLHGHTSSFSFV